MITLIRRASAAVLALALFAGNGALCAGWAVSPEARMACCADERACPMHKSDSAESGHHGMTQAQADACCATSERDTSGPSTPTFAIPLAVPGPATILPIEAPALVLSERQRHAAPPPVAVPKHVLLSVFLV